MSTASPDVGQLIADAKLVAAYGTRTGKLPDGRLIEAVAVTEGALAANQPRKARLDDLAAALNHGVQAIAPTTLLDLGSTWRPYPDNRVRRIGRVAFAVFAVLLILVTSYYTQTYTQANAILAQLTDSQSRDAHDKAERLYRLFVENHEKLLDHNNPVNDTVVFEPYLRSYSELFALSGQISTYSQFSANLAGRPDIAWLLTLMNGKEEVNRLGKQCNYKGPKNEPVCAEDTQEASIVKTAFVAQAPMGSDSTPPANEEPDLSIMLKDVGLDSLLVKQKLLAEFLWRSGVDVVFVQNPPLNLIYNCQQILTLLGFWVLPALYGLLGATVFQLRAILNPMIPDPSPARLFLRLSLGGFAGITIFLLFGPERTTFFEGTSSAIGTFGLAFLFGFSIEVFFGVLDRLVGIASQSLAQPTKPPAGK